MALPTSLAARGTRTTGHGVAIALYPGDATFAIEVERAPDSAGSPDVGNSTLETIAPGVSVYVDEQEPTGATFHYRFRHVRDGYTKGPQTAWVALVAVELPPKIPTKPPGTGTVWINPSLLAWVPLYQEDPEGPTSLSGEEGVTQNTVDLTWTDNATDEIAYEVQRAPDVAGSPGTWDILTSALAAGTAAYSDTDSGTLSGQALWWYRVRCRSVYGYGDFSAEVQVDLSAA